MVVLRTKPLKTNVMTHVHDAKIATTSSGRHRFNNGAVISPPTVLMPAFQKKSNRIYLLLTLRQHRQHIIKFSARETRNCNGYNRFRKRPMTYDN